MNSEHFSRVLCLASLALSFFAIESGFAAAGEFSPEQIDFFERKIRPVLVERCYSCHSAESEKLKGGLRLDSREGQLKGGDTGPAIVPGAPDQSLLITAVSYTDEKLQMPPKDKLSERQIADLVSWIQMGAPWPGSVTSSAPAKSAAPARFDLAERAQHWSFQPLRAAPPPKVKRGEWIQSPIDAFILEPLEARALGPAPPAGKRALLRRATFDLIGLPPTREEIEAFVRDDSPDAFRRVVERLLASPHYGERWARHWLDLVRYAETAGHEFDYDYPSAYRYRDYVIRAFNSDVPYDQFVVEHIAGDLLSQPRLHPLEGYNESVIGTAFWFLGESTHSPVDVLEDETARVENQIDVFGKTFLGLTLACARCHDHKFDPISARDYYALAGFLQSSRFQEAFVDPPQRFQPAIQEMKTIDAQAKRLAAGAAAQRAPEQARLFATLASSHLTDPASAPATTSQGIAKNWKQALESARKQRHHPLHPLAVLTAGAAESSFPDARNRLAQELRQLTSQHAQAIQSARCFADFNSANYGDWFVTGHAFGEQPTQRFELRLGKSARDPVRGILPPGVAHSGRISTKLQGALRSPTFTIEQNQIWLRVGGKGGTVNLILDGFQRIRDPIYGGLTFKVNSGDELVWRSIDVATWKGHNAYLEFLDHGDEEIAIDAIYFSNEKLPPEPPNARVLALLAGDSATGVPALVEGYERLLREALARALEFPQREGQGPSPDADADAVTQLANWILQSGLLLEANDNANPPSASLAGLANLLEARARLEQRLPVAQRVMAMADGTSENQRLYIRGNHRNPGPEIPRQFLEVFCGTNQPAPKAGSGRLALAERMVTASKPLLARVLVNRLWKHHFGEGLVRTPDDFGQMGQPPSHPELLDYLASQLIEERWSIKQMHRLLMLSSTYQMSSQADPRFDTADPENRWWHRMPIRRLEAEIIRDALLAVSGRLDRSFYGSSVPVHLTPFMNGRGRPDKSGPLDGDGRRSIYLNVRRNFLNPMFLAFDYPVPFSTMGKRTASNVPAQALALMNNPFVLQQAGVWAQRVLSGPERSMRERIESLFLDAFARPPDEDELSAATAFLEARLDESAGSESTVDELGVWRDFCHVLFNVKEFVFIN